MRVSSIKPAEKKKNFDMLKDGIQANKLYKSNLGVRVPTASKVIKENCEKIKGNKIVPGQMIYFNYFEPKTKEELEYYDATPCTIYFSTFQSNDGLRVLGFNLHYYPPRIRYRIISLIYKLFKPMFDQTWEDGPGSETPYFNYKYIVDTLEKYNLGFGVRMYDPGLIADARLVPTKWIPTAMFTEGNFKKRTREQIMHYWRNWNTKEVNKKKADARTSRNASRKK